MLNDHQNQPAGESSQKWSCDGTTFGCCWRSPVRAASPRPRARLGVSLTTIGRRLRALERSLGVVLVERRPDGHRLTARAQALVPAASRMAAAAGDLRAGAGPGVAEVRILAREWEALFLIRHLQALRSALPNIHIELGHKHWPDLARWEADLVLTDHSPSASNVVVRKLGSMAFAIYAGRGYVAAEPRAFSPDRFQACDWAGLTPARGRGPGSATGLVGRAGPTPGPGIRCVARPHPHVQLSDERGPAPRAAPARCR